MIYDNNLEERRGFVAAMQAIERGGDTVDAARHHRGVASSDLRPNAFTAGWKRACDEFISVVEVRDHDTH